MSSSVYEESFVKLNAKDYGEFMRRVNGTSNVSPNSRLVATAKRVGKINAVRINGTSVGRVYGNAGR